MGNPDPFMLLWCFFTMLPGRREDHGWTLGTPKISYQSLLHVTELQCKLITLYKKGTAYFSCNELFTEGRWCYVPAVPHREKTSACNPRGFASVSCTSFFSYFIYDRKRKYTYVMQQSEVSLKHPVCVAPVCNSRIIQQRGLQVYSDTSCSMCQYSLEQWKETRYWLIHSLTATIRFV